MNDEGRIAKKPEHTELKNAAHHFNLSHIWGEDATFNARDGGLIAKQQFRQRSL